MSGDNSDMVMVRRVSAVQPPNNPRTGNVYDKDGALKTVYVNNPRFQKDDTDYEPYDHRQVTHPTTYAETLIHLLKASLGTGVLSMPGAFKDAGWFIGLIGTALSGFICTYTMHILIASEYELCKKKKKPSMSYSETFEAAVEQGPERTRWLSKWVPHFVNILLFVYQTGTCCIYVVFISRNVKDVVDYYMGDDNWKLSSYMISLLFPLILISWVRNLKYLAPLSTIANALTVVSFSIIFYYLFRGLPSLSERRAIGELGRMPLFFSTVLFAMEAIGAVMPLENEMKSPKKFKGTFGVLNMAMIPIVLLYLFVGFFGFYRYGEGLKETLTLSMPQDEKLAQSVKAMLAISIFVTHALVDYVAFDILYHEYIQATYGPNIVVEYLVRTLLVCINVVGAIYIPYIDLFISLMGAVCLSTMGLGIPALVQLLTYWDDVHGVKFAAFAIKNIAIICVGLFAFVIGTYVSLGEIVQKIKDEP